MGPLVPTIEEILKGLDCMYRRENIGPGLWMNQHQLIYNYCNSTSMATPLAPPTMIQATPIESPHKTYVETPCHRIYSKFEDYITNYCEEVSEKLLEFKAEQLLEAYCREWSDYRFSSNVMHSTADYLNRHYFQGSKEVKSMFHMTLVIWQKSIIDFFQDQLIGAVLEAIQAAREGQKSIIDNRFIAEFLRSLVEMEIYEEFFEIDFLKTTQEFYTLEIQNLLNSNVSGREYLQKIHQRIQEEQIRTQLCLHGGTWTPLSNLLLQIMVRDQLTFIHSNFEALLDAQADLELKILYDLCSKVPNSLKSLYGALETYIKKYAEDSLTPLDPRDHQTYVRTLLDIIDRFQSIIDCSFSMDPYFLKALDSAAMVFVNENPVISKFPKNQRPMKSYDLIAKFCDGMMRKGSKIEGEIEMEETQRKVIPDQSLISEIIKNEPKRSKIAIFKKIKLLEYLHDKDIFLKIYTKHFARRLINGQSASEEAETSFIAKLTEEFGCEYTFRLQKMVQDTQISKDLSSGFKDQKSEASRATKIEFGIQVLSTGTWPSFQLINLNLPRDLMTTVEGFSEFYNRKFSGRKLSWVHTQSRGELTSMAFKGKKYVFGVTTPQMVIMMLFNEQLSYSPEKLREASGMDQKSAQIVLGSLAKSGILKIEDSEDEVCLNLNYSNKKVRVDLSRITVDAQETKETEAVQKVVDENRTFIISAAIVRIMKMRKQSTHQNLMTELIDQLKTRFKPKVELIKKCIGIMIEKEYIRRNEKDRDIYEYRA
ncbi:hypothetical protein B9Z55_021900 [Caenorhabditis nigoni]|uniref:Cullin family profile domain-containing protein n=1 Tax=Caenorhabditis nigoni TaxID=1611254 RepID=A0A2G5TU61_9PELO|nr:hypothetical protein B9Z55_021900 [Caenorhabditis nigoni]